MRLIRVLHNFGGHVTAERRIEPGLYSEDDPRLFGVGDYLLENGHAELAGVLPDPEPVADEISPPNETDGESGGEQTPTDETDGEPADVSPAGEDAPPADEAPAPTSTRKKKAE